MMPPLPLSGRWVSSNNSLRLRVARMLKQSETAQRIEALLREHGDPVAYEVFDREFVLCAPHVPGVPGDPDVAFVLGMAEHDLFFVAQRERGALGRLSVHESIHDALRDFLGRAMGARGLSHLSNVIVMGDPA